MPQLEPELVFIIILTAICNILLLLVLYFIYWTHQRTLHYLRRNIGVPDVEPSYFPPAQTDA